MQMGGENLEKFQLPPPLSPPPPFPLPQTIRSLRVKNSLKNIMQNFAKSFEQLFPGNVLCIGVSIFPQNTTPSFLPISQFEFLVTTEQSIFVYRLFCH